MYAVGVIVYRGHGGGSGLAILMASFKAVGVIKPLTGWDDRPSNSKKLTSTTRNRNLGGYKFVAEYNLIL